MFFYAGRAFPELNIQVVLLYGGIFDSDNKDESNIENIIQENNSDLMDCGVRPFDSGGLVTKKLKLNLSSCIKKVEGVSQVKSYFDEHNLSELLEWRRYFALFLTSFFKSPQDYWDGFPNKKIDGTSFKKNDCWRNWTFEIHSNWHVSPKFAGVIMIDERLERHARNQAGFGGKPIMAPIVRRIAQFHYSPREKAEHDMRIICLNNNKNET